jgi:hypothetical protein
MSRATEDRNRRLLRARDTIDRSYASPLEVAALARVAQGTVSTQRAAAQYVPACVEKTLRRPAEAATPR